MSESAIDYVLDGKTVRTAHRHDGHGHVLRIEFTDGTTLYVWGFERPDRLEIVLSDEGRIVEDMRSDACREESDRFIAKSYEPRWTGDDDVPLFKTFHQRSPR